MNNHLTAKEEQFAVARAYGKTQIDAFKDAGYFTSTRQTMAVEASRIESRPHIKARIEELRRELKDEQKDAFTWNRDIATQRLFTLMDKIEHSDKLLTRHAPTILNCVITLNQMWVVEKEKEGRIQIVIGGGRGPQDFDPPDLF